VTRIHLTNGALWAILAGIGIVLVAWLVPLPPVIAGEEALAAKTIPADRAQARTAAEEFHAADGAYRAYIGTHDLGALLITAREAITESRAAPDDVDRLAQLKEAAAQVSKYAEVLFVYAQASDHYLNALRGYDDKLMSWTRALGPASEGLRPATFPFVEHLKNYPKPVGLKTDPPMVSGQQVEEQLAALSGHIVALGIGTQSDVGPTLKALDRDVTAIWESGRSVEYIASLHDTYYGFLQTYDRQVEAAANSVPSAGPSGGRRLIAGALAALVSLAAVAGIAALFAPRPELQA
jgi:hypothetical protein